MSDLFFKDEDIEFLKTLKSNPYSKDFSYAKSELWDNFCNYRNYSLHAPEFVKVSDEKLQNLDDMLMEYEAKNDKIQQENWKICQRVDKIVLEMCKTFGNPPKKTNHEIKQSFLTSLSIFRDKLPRYSKHSLFSVVKYFSFDRYEESKKNHTLKCYESGKLNLVKAKHEILEFKEKEIKKVECDSKKKKLYLEYALNHKDEISDASFIDDNTLFKEVDTHARHEYRENYLKEHQNEEMDISCCSECSTWNVGDHRCSCGNVRVYLAVSGDLATGFYEYADQH